MPEGGSSGSGPRRAPHQAIFDAVYGRRYRPDETDVFCGPSAPPREVLFATKNFLVFPDRYPVTPGHILIIPRRHRPAFAAVPEYQEAELRQVIERVSAFVRDAYSCEPLLWENGGIEARQTVHHAHLHVMPMPQSVAALPPPVSAVPIEPGLAPLRRWWRSKPDGCGYHFVQFRGERRLMPALAADVYTLNQFKGDVLAMPKDEKGRWLRRHDPLEIARTHALWRRWEAEHPAPHLHRLTPPRDDLAA